MWAHQRLPRSSLHKKFKAQQPSNSSSNANSLSRTNCRVQSQKLQQSFSPSRSSQNSPTCRIGSSVRSCTRLSTTLSCTGYISLLLIESWNRSKFVAFWLKIKAKKKEKFRWAIFSKRTETCCVSLRSQIDCLILQEVLVDERRRANPISFRKKLSAAK